MNWRRVARVSELRPGEARRVVLDGIEIALCNVAGEFFAVDDVCTHAYASLSEGLLSGAEIECYARSIEGWAYFLNSLALYATTGTGRPFSVQVAS